MDSSTTTAQLSTSSASSLSSSSNETSNNINSNHSIPPTITPGATTTSSSSVPIDYEAVSQMLAPFDCPFSADELYTVQQQIELSRFDILDTDQHMEKVGYGVYPLTTLYIQHSCRPNTGIIYRQDKQRIIALDDIAVGDVITISYVDLTLPRDARMNELQRRFGVEYDCQCERCHGPFSCLDQLLERGQQSGLRIDQATAILEEDITRWDTSEVVTYLTSKAFDGTIPVDAKLYPSELSHYVANFIAPDVYIEGSTTMEPTFITRQLVGIGGINSFESYAAFAKQARKNFIQGIPPLLTKLLTCNEVPVFTVNMIRAAEVALRKLMDHQQWLEAARCATFLFIMYRIMYPPLHPVCSFHTIVLAKASWNSLIQLELQSATSSSASSVSSTSNSNNNGLHHNYSNNNGLDVKLEKNYLNGIRTWIDISRDATLLTFGQDSTLWREVVDLQWVFERDQKLR
ncbi:hypothetical protein BJ944DRAFT_264551 [Cunninghamella echinulata]|nr:hypothetical protein BJ944DRAFT_264551 [Cunninghamella echinulata]